MADPTLPEGWPTLEEVDVLRERGITSSIRENTKLCEAAEWAVRVRPQLEALVEKVDAKVAEIREARVDWTDDRVANALENVSQGVARLLTPHEEHEETQR